MKYMLMFTDNEGMGDPSSAAVQEMYGKVGEWWGKHSQSGALLSGEQLGPARTATTVSTRDGTVTDGPFIEAKESIGGFAIIDVPDLDAAIAMAKTWPASEHVEIRPLLEMEAGH